MEHFESLESTQDEVKKLLHDASRHGEFLQFESNVRIVDRMYV